MRVSRCALPFSDVLKLEKVSLYHSIHVSMRINLMI